MQERVYLNLGEKNLEKPCSVEYTGGVCSVCTIWVLDVANYCLSFAAFVLALHLVHLAGVEMPL
jgi:hypothetical protein